MREVERHDLKARRILVRHEVCRVAAQVQVRHRIVDIGHLAPRCRRAADRVDPGGVEGPFVLHAVRDHADDPRRGGRIGDERDVLGRHRNGFGELEAEDCRILVGIRAQRVQEDLALQVAVGGRRLGRELCQAVVEEALAVFAPGRGAELRAVDPVGELPAARCLDDLEHTVLRAADGDSGGHVASVERRHEVVDRVMLLLRRELLRVEQEPLVSLEPLADVELAIVRAGLCLEIEVAPLRPRNGGDRCAGVVETLDPLCQLRARRDLLEHGPRVVVLGLHPTDHLGALGFLHPPVRVDDLLPEVGLDDLFDRGRRRRALRQRGARGEKTDSEDRD